MTTSDAENWGGQDYLRDVQYRDSSLLARRAGLHTRYGSGGWFSWVAAQHPWPADGEVLEIGCGPGKFWDDFPAQAADTLRITLTDLSEGMVGEATQRLRSSGRWRAVEGRTADVSALPFEDSAFDVVLAMHMLYHAPEPSQGAAEICRVLRPGGVALITTNGLSMPELDSLRAKVFGAGIRRASDRFNLENGGPMLGAIFDEVELRQRKDILRCTDPEDVVSYLTSFPPADQATDDHLTVLRAGLAEAAERGGGVLELSTLAGVFLCRKGREKAETGV